LTTHVTYFILVTDISDGGDMKVSMKDISEGKRGVLAGALNGRRVFAKLLEYTIQEPLGPEEVFLDFGSVTVATASFLRESVFAFRDAVRQRRSNFYPVIANASEVVMDELRILLDQTTDALLLCELNDSGKASSPRLLGQLDPKQRRTFELVRERGETDAAELMRAHGKSEEIGQTAWNNRLAALAGLGVVVEVSVGRGKRYRPLLTEG
jgi:hypothetical protein